MKRRFLAAPYVVWMLLFTIVPLGIIAVYTFTDPSGTFTFKNIVSILDYAPIFLRSIWLSAAATALCLVLGYPAAYFIASCTPRTQRMLQMLIMLPMCLSFLLRTLAWVAILEDTGIINNILSAAGIGPLPLIRNNGAVILGMVYNYLPYMILPLYTSLSKIDYRLIEAGSDLGCSKRQLFTRVTFPLSLPGVTSGITMVFVPAVSTFYISQKLGSTGSVMVGDIIESQFKNSYNPNLGAAMSLLLMILIFICVGISNHFTGTDSGEDVS